MALLTSELRRLRVELGYSAISIEGMPFVDHVSVFDQVIAPYLEAGAASTSTTAVTAASTPTPVTLTLASATGFSTGCSVVVDVDSRQEIATIQNLSGTSMTVLLSLAHSGTYAVTVEGGESIVREQLKKLRDIDERITSAATSAGLKSVGRGAVEWYGDGSMTVISQLQALQMHHRDELASILGVTNMWRLKTSGAASRSELY